MRLTFSPVRMDAPLTASVAGDTITLNDETVDLSDISEGASINAGAFGCDWITGEVTRQDGVLHLTLILPHGGNAPQETLWPEPVEAGDGPVVLPVYEVEGEEVQG